MPSDVEGLVLPIQAALAGGMAEEQLRLRAFDLPLLGLGVFALFYLTP